MLKDPRKIYRTSPMPDQEQDTPAIQEEMLPKPDCGEESYLGSGKLKGRNALITGGDSGIGRACAIAYAREGANVAITYFKEGDKSESKDALEVKKLIEAEGVKALIIGGDLREDSFPLDIVTKTIEEFGALDILVLNAAQQIAHEKLSDFKLEQLKDTFKINIISMIETIKAAEKFLEAGSTIITTSSVQAYDPSFELLDYAATKASITNITKSLAKYFIKKGIRVNSVAPGPIWTPIQLDNGQVDGAIKDFGQFSLLERPGQPVELSPVYVFLASEESSYVTSQVYGVTGGSQIN